MLNVSFFPSRFHELPGGDYRQALDVARMADDAGLYSIQLGDHLLVGDRTDRYPYGTYRHERDASWLEPIATLGAFAGVTSSIRLSMGVLLAPLRPAPLLAKQLATLDVLSGGRVEPGIGIGWQREEYAAEGLDWRERHRIFEETIVVCRALWGEQPVSVRTTDMVIEDAYAVPRPAQARIPILYGVALTTANADLIARLGDGWTPVTTLDEIAEAVPRLHAAFERHGRSADEAIVRGRLPLQQDKKGHIDVAATLAQAPAYEEAGVSVHTVVLPVGYGEIFTSMHDLGAFIAEIGRRAGEY